MESCAYCGNPTEHPERECGFKRLDNANLRHIGLRVLTVEFDEGAEYDAAMDNERAKLWPR